MPQDVGFCCSSDARIGSTEVPRPGRNLSRHKRRASEHTLQQARDCPLTAWLLAVAASKVFTRHLAFSSVFAKRVIQAAAERDSGFRCCRGSLRPRPVPFSHLACLVVPVSGRGWRRAGVRPPQHRVHVQAWPCLLSLEVCAQLFGSSASSLVAGRSDIADSFPRSGRRQPVCGYWA